MHYARLAFFIRTRTECTNFAIMLPGSATLKVHSRPLVGLKTAVGLEVSSTTGNLGVPFGTTLGGFCMFCFASDNRLRFYLL